MAPSLYELSTLLSFNKYAPPATTTAAAATIAKTFYSLLFLLKFKCNIYL